MYNCTFSRPAPKCVKIRRGDKILEDQPHNYEDDSEDDSDQVKYLPDNVTKYRYTPTLDDSEDDSDQVKYLPDNVTKYRYTPTFYFKHRRSVCMFP
jgi:hypothetical protein